MPETVPESPWTESILWGVKMINPEFQEGGRVVPHYYSVADAWVQGARGRLLFERRSEAQAILWYQRDDSIRRRGTSNNIKFELIRVTCRHRAIKRGV